VNCMMGVIGRVVTSAVWRNMVGQTRPDNPSRLLGTRAICIAVIWALAVFWAGVPTPALVNLLSWLAHLGQPVKHIALAATELVGLLVMIAREIVSTICWMRVNRMSLEKILWSNNISTRAAESINLVEDLPVTESGQITSLLCSYTAANLHVEDQRVGARELKSSTIIALNVFITNGLIRMIEYSVSFLTLLISILRRFLDKLPSPTVNIVGKDTFLMVRNAVIEKESLWTVLYGCYTFPAYIKQIALLLISELSIWFWTFKERSFVSVVLCRDERGGGCQDQD